jgi:hypothetical protein
MLDMKLGGPQNRSGRRPGLELRPLSHPARSQSLYRLPRMVGFLMNNGFERLWTLLEVSSRHSPGGTEKYHEKLHIIQLISGLRFDYMFGSISPKIKCLPQHFFSDTLNQRSSVKWRNQLRHSYKTNGPTRSLTLSGQIKNQIDVTYKNMSKWEILAWKSQGRKTI